MSSVPDLVFHVGGLYDGAGRWFAPAELYLHSGQIVGIQAVHDKSLKAERLRLQATAARRYDLPDSILLPGLVNAHHHLYSTFARGLPSGGPFSNFPAILKNLWWRLDRALDLDAVALSAQVAMAEGIRHGCTTVIDHHSSPTAICGSLETIAGEARRFGLTAILCFEISDRNGVEVAAHSLAENLEFATLHADDPNCRGLLGLHASFTLTDRTLKRIADAKPASLPIHVHVAEDRCDVDHARGQGFSGPLVRLDAYGLVDERSLLVHGVHLSSAELDLVRESGAWMAQNSESNANNRVGYADPGRFRADRLLLGTDGMHSHPLGALRFAWLQNAALGEHREEGLERLERQFFRNPAEYLSRLFGRAMGTVRVGAAADFVIFPYPSPTPLTECNVMAHLIYALSDRAEASWVYANGRPVLAEGRLAGVDEAVLYREARKAAARVWERFQRSDG